MKRLDRLCFQALADELWLRSDASKPRSLAALHNLFLEGHLPRTMKTKLYRRLSWIWTNYELKQLNLKIDRIETIMYLPI